MWEYNVGYNKPDISKDRSTLLYLSCNSTLTGTFLVCEYADRWH